jgi:hypothetical protein
MTEDLIKLFNQHFARDMTAIFDQYLRYPQLPTLELAFDESSVRYRWRADVEGFDMPIRVGGGGDWQVIQPTTQWQTLKQTVNQAEFKVDTERFYVRVEILDAPPAGQ